MEKMNLKTLGRNYSIDIYRVFFTFGIILMHFESAFFPSEHRVFEGMYLGVDFFFLLSGYLICASMKKHPQFSAWDFFAHKIKSFLPLNFVLIFATNVLQIIATKSIDKGKIFNGIVDLFFLQMFLPSRFVNFPLWYVSVLIYGSIFLFLILKLSKSNYTAIFIGGGVLLCFLAKTYPHIDMHTGSTELLKFAPGVIRGISEMAIGIGFYKIGQKFCFKKLWLWRLLGIVAGAMIVFKKPHTGLDYIFVFLAAFLIVVEFQSEQFRFDGIAKKIASHIGVLCTGVYFVHSLCISRFPKVLEFFHLSAKNIGMTKSMLLFALVTIIFTELALLLAKTIGKINFASILFYSEKSLP